MRTLSIVFALVIISSGVAFSAISSGNRTSMITHCEELFTDLKTITSLSGATIEVDVKIHHDQQTEHYYRKHINP